MDVEKNRLKDLFLLHQEAQEEEKKARARQSEILGQIVEYCNGQTLFTVNGQTVVICRAASGDYFIRRMKKGTSL